jgi:hypothetical protein
MRAVFAVIAALFLTTGPLASPAAAYDRDERRHYDRDRHDRDRHDRDRHDWRGRDRDRDDRERHHHHWRDRGWNDRNWHDQRSYGPVYRHQYGRCEYVQKRIPGGWKEVRVCRDRPHAALVIPFPQSAFTHSALSRPDYTTTVIEPAYALPPPAAAGRAWGDTYQEADGRFCREYQTEGFIGGQLERLYGTACLTEGGDWEFVR